MNEAFSDRAWRPPPRLGWAGDLLPCRGAHTAVPEQPHLAASPGDAVGSRLHPTANARQGQNASGRALARGLLFVHAGAFFRACQQLQIGTRGLAAPLFSMALGRSGVLARCSPCPQILL